MNALTVEDRDQIDKLADLIAKHSAERILTYHPSFHTAEVLVALINSQTQLTAAYLGGSAALAVVDRSAQFAQSMVGQN
ncbi:MAG: hypothetical protein EBU46_19395 [Nitrosomonadaceae bacterium]|nr:hypothetical protein [Nitrosomonadaceae bacterium]